MQKEFKWMWWFFSSKSRHLRFMALEIISYRSQETQGFLVKEHTYMTPVSGCQERSTHDK